MTIPIRHWTLEPVPRQECQRLLRLNDLGRLAWPNGTELMVVPVNYTLDGADIVLRTDPGGPIGQTAVGAPAAFQVDDLHRDGHIGWTVLAQVTPTLVEDPVERRRLQQRDLQPWAPGDRSSYVRLTITALSGRQLRYVVAPSPSRHRPAASATDGERHRGAALRRRTSPPVR